MFWSRLILVLGIFSESLWPDCFSRERSWGWVKGSVWGWFWAWIRGGIWDQVWIWIYGALSLRLEVWSDEGRIHQQVNIAPKIMNTNCVKTFELWLNKLSTLLKLVFKSSLFYWFQNNQLDIHNLNWLDTVLYIRN